MIETDSIRIVEMPDLGAVNDSSSVVGERAGSGRFSAIALRAYCAANISAAMAPVCAAPTIAAAVKQFGPIGVVTTSSPVLQFDIPESLNMGSGFFDAIVVNHIRNAGVGHRQSFTAQITMNGASVNEMNVAAAFFGFLETGSGNVFGGNSYARVYSTAAATANCCSFEANTDVQQPMVGSKIGIQIIDTATSSGDGLNGSAALLIGRQPGGFGYRDGILFGSDLVANMGAARNALIRSGNAAGSATATRGIDFTTASFAGAAIALPSGGSGAGGISWGGGGEGGELVSDTTANGPLVHFGNNALSVTGSSGSTAMLLGTTATPTVSVWVTGVGLRQFAAGAPDSGGAGFRLLVVPN
jgi:hypothetical protein